MVVSSQPSTVDALFASAERDFERWEIVKDLVDESHRPRAELPPERPPRRVALQGPHAAVADALRRRCAGTCAGRGCRSAIASCSAPATPCRSSTRRWPCSTRHSASRHERDGDARLRVPRRRPVGAHLGAAAQAAAARRPARPRRDGGQDPLPEVQHRAVGPRHGARPRARHSRSSTPARTRSRSSSSRARAA